MTTRNESLCKKIPIIEYDEYEEAIITGYTHGDCQSVKNAIIQDLHKAGILSESEPTITDEKNIDTVFESRSNYGNLPKQIKTLKDLKGDIADKIEEEIRDNIGAKLSYMLDPRIDPRIENYVIDNQLERDINNFCDGNPEAAVSPTLGMFCPPKKKKVNIGVIIGAVVGGVVFIGLLVYLIKFKK